MSLETNFPALANALRYLSARRLLTTKVVKYIVAVLVAMRFTVARRVLMSGRQWIKFSERTVLKLVR